MKISSITLFGFRCFGTTKPTAINLANGITAFVGANGTGKTAVLDALARMFGITTEQRTIKKTDFYTPPNAGSDVSEKELWIEANIIFPKLKDEKEDASVPECFNQMSFSIADNCLACKIRLEAKWVKDETLDGTIEPKLYWITSDGIVTNENKQLMRSHERGFIQVHYVQASRGGADLTKYANRAMMSRLLKAVTWSEKIRAAVKTNSQQIIESFAKESPIETINSSIKKHWQELHDSQFDSKPELEIVSTEIEEFIKNTRIRFSPTESGDYKEIEALSDGQKSLFYFSLAASVFEIERKIENKKTTGFDSEKLHAPYLTIFALEEPENHLAPYYLSRIVDLIRTIARGEDAQAVLSSHSPSIVGRIEPEEVRHFRIDQETKTSVVNEILLPSSLPDEEKYVREAVRSFPEIYFARFVILGEGDSEQIILPRIAKSMNLPIDRSFVAIAPLGGRHVNHFWKLLSGLEIPYATLLDLDLGRDGGGWARIHYICKQLVDCGIDREKLLMTESGPLSYTDFEAMKTWKGDVHLSSWIDLLEQYGVFFSHPLDIDFYMLRQFPDNYKKIETIAQGPQIPKESTKKEQYLDNAESVVFGDKGSGLSEYLPENKQIYRDEALFAWYRYLFLNHSKPTSHMLALSQIDDESLASTAPQRIKNLLDYVVRNLFADREVDDSISQS